MAVIPSTPLETYAIRGVPVLVKREDLCCPLPGPAFSKMRGVYAHIAKRQERIIGVLDTYHSQAGWAVAYACSLLGKTAINYWPHYAKEAPGVLRPPQQRSRDLGAQLVSLPAGRSFILYHQAKADLLTAAPPSEVYMMPNALKLPESVTENAAEFARTPLPEDAEIVISISSGTVAAGVLRGLAERGQGETSVVLHMGYSRSISATKAYIQQAVGLPLNWSSISIVDQGYAYGDAVDMSIPFPCNKYYDAKAWAWLSITGVAESRSDLSGHRSGRPVVFWNIGA